MKFRVFGGKPWWQSPDYFLENRPIIFWGDPNKYYFCKNFWYKPHRLEISGRMNLQVINSKRGRPAPAHEEINPQKSQNILELQAKETNTKGKKKKKPDKALNPKNLKAKLKVVSEIIRQ